MCLWLSVDLCVCVQSGPVVTVTWDAVRRMVSDWWRHTGQSWCLPWQNVELLIIRQTFFLIKQFSASHASQRVLWSVLFQVFTQSSARHSSWQSVHRATTPTLCFQSHLDHVSVAMLWWAGRQQAMTDHKQLTTEILAVSCCHKTTLLTFTDAKRNNGSRQLVL